VPPASEGEIDDVSATETLPWGEITDETIAHAAELTGTELRRDRFRWVSEATFDAIQHFAEGIGDRNPLWRSREYAQGTRWGAVLAPPTFLYAVDFTVVAPRLAGVQWIYAGTDWTFYDVVRLGDGFDPVTTFLGQELKGGEFARRWVMQTGHVRYVRRSDGALVAEANGHTARTPRGEALKREGRTKYELRTKQEYTAEQIEDIERQILAETPRGATPRHWEDVEVGEQVRPVVKGPLTTTDIVAWYAGAFGVRLYGGAHADVVHYRNRHADFHISEITGAKDNPGRGHLEVQTGSDVGMGGAYDIGPQRISWGAHMLTDWMGDDGFLHKLSVSVRRPNLVGDTTWWKGRVTGKQVVRGHHLVELDVHTEDQLGHESARGRATVVLPSRDHGPVSLPLPADLTTV
jgi:acyl dehydratase